MKICVVGLRGFPNVMGGIEKHCEQIFPRMAALDASAEVTIIGRSPYLQQARTTFQGVDIVSLWAVRNKYLETILHTFLAIFYARLVVRADVIHIHAIGPGLLVPLARLLGMKVVFTHHGADYNRQKWSAFAKTLLRMGEWVAISASHRSIIVGASLCEDLKRRFPRQAEKIQHIPNGADVGAAGNESTAGHPVLAQFGLERGRYVLAVGRLVPEKGFQDLVKAYQKTAIDKVLVITGNSDHPDAFSRSLLDQKSDRIIFTGFQSGAALAAIFSNAGLFVLPSYHEGLPIVALEAIGHGVPVLLSDIEPNLDIHLSNECYFPVGNVDALAGKLSAPDYECYRVDRAAILHNYNWDDIAQRTLQAFHAAAQASAPPPLKQEG